MATLQLTSVRKRFGDVEALSDISFTLADGQLMALLGPSGAGKTTTLKMIAGVEMPDGGEIRIAGRLMEAVVAEQRNIALVFENYALYPNMTVFENLAFPLKAPTRSERLTKDRVATRVHDVAHTLGIGELLSRRTWELSGGQKQRVALGRALVRKPDVFLMDEPISHLDAKLRFEMRAELKRLQKDIGITTLYATPDYAEAMALSDAIAVLQDGRIAQVGSPSAVFSAPVNTYVAHLVGEPHINLLEMRVQSDANGSAVIGDGVRFELHPSQAMALRQKRLDRFIVGVRPSDLSVSLFQNGRGVLPARVLAVEPRGSTTIVVLRAGPHQISAKIRGECGLEPNIEVCATVEPPSLYFFEPKTGDRIDMPLVGG